MNYELFMAEAIAEARRGGEEGEGPLGPSPSSMMP